MRFNGIDPRTIHPGVSIAKEIPPGAVTSQLETLTGSTGEIVAGRTIQQGEYIVRVNIAGKSRAEAWKIRALLAGWARADDEKTRKLIPTHDPTVHYEAILKEISPPEFTFGFTTVDVVFTLPRPVAIDNEEQTYSTEMASQAVQSIEEAESYQYFLTDDGYVFNTADGEVFLTKSTDESELTIGGTTWVRPAIAMYMYAAEGLTLMVDGKPVLSISGEYEEGDSVFIYTDPPSVQLMDGSMPYSIDDRIDYTVTDFEALCRALTPGKHTITAVGAATLTMTWRNAWL